MIKKDTFSHYICGLVDGEGSFNVSLQSDPTHKNGLRLKPAFSIGLHKEDRPILEQIKKHFSCGSLREINKIANYEVSDIKHLIGIIIPFFEKHNLRAKKKEDFIIFRNICLLINQKYHLNPTGFNKILKMRSSMNRIGKRRKLDF